MKFIRHVGNVFEVEPQINVSRSLIRNLERNGIHNIEAECHATEKKLQNDKGRKTVFKASSFPLSGWLRAPFDLVDMTMQLSDSINLLFDNGRYSKEWNV